MPVAYFEPIDRSELMQGDVLQRTPELNAILQTVHPHYNDLKNRYFMVITQSCDLVERKSGYAKAPYIALAPVRSIDLVIDKYIVDFQKSGINTEVPIIREKFRNKLSEALERLFNNNDPHYFYLDATNTGLSVDCATFLRLSISVKTPLHFDTCRSAKILQLTPGFQAKLGWLVGQLYSRVATDDWDVDELRQKKNKIVKDVAAWISDDSFPELEQSLMAAYPDHSEQAIGRLDIAKTMKSLPTAKKKFASRIAVIRNALEPDVVKRFNYRESKLRKAVEAAGVSIIALMTSEQGKPQAQKGYGEPQVSHANSNEPKTTAEEAASASKAGEIDSILGGITAEIRKISEDNRQLIELFSKRIESDQEIASYVK